MALLPFLAFRDLFCAHVHRKGSLTLKMRNMWSLYLLPGQDSVPLCSCHYLHLRGSVHRGQISAAWSGAHLFPPRRRSRRKTKTSIDGVLLGFQALSEHRWDAEAGVIIPVKVTQLAGNSIRIRIPKSHLQIRPWAPY